jgi:uncharacterized phage infection (PIP) family protein YhgE
VAEEIRKLSDTTKSLLKSMDELLEEVNTGSAKSKDSVDLNTRLIKKTSDSMIAMSEVVISNAKSIDTITQKLENISAFTEQLHASLEEVSAGMSTISEDAEMASSIANDIDLLGDEILNIAIGIEDIETQVDTLTKQGGNLAADPLYGLSNTDFASSIKSAIEAHINWIKNLKDMVNKKISQPLQIDDHKCGFGHFYYSVTPKSDKILPLWQEVEEHHSELHKKGEIAIELLDLSKEPAYL